MRRPRRRDVLLGLAATAAAGGIGAPRAGTPPGSIALWGDSLTFGTGADTVAGKYPNLLGRLFTPPRAVFNGGVGGEISPQIAARMLADEAHRSWIAVLWAGRNNIESTDTVLADIAAMAAHLGHPRFLVLSILNADVPEDHAGGAIHSAMSKLNAALRRRYAERYVDVRTALVHSGLAELGLEPTPRDRLDTCCDVPPTSLRADHIHLNDRGQAVIARHVRDAILRQGW